METHETETVADNSQASSALAVLEQFSTSAEGIKLFSHLVVNEVEEGRADALQVALFMKTIEKIKEEVNAKLGRHYVTAAEKYAEKIIKYRGAEISLGEVGTKIDYASSGHPGWNDLTRIIEEATKQRKEIEDFLKVIKSPQVIVIDGEAVEVKPPVRSSTTGIKISIK